MEFQYSNGYSLTKGFCDCYFLDVVRNYDDGVAFKNVHRTCASICIGLTIKTSHQIHIFALTSV